MAAVALTHVHLPVRRRKKSKGENKERQNLKGQKCFSPVETLLFHWDRDTSPRDFHLHFIGQNYNIWLAVAVREAWKLSILFSSLFGRGRQVKRELGMNVE